MQRRNETTYGLINRMTAVGTISGCQKTVAPLAGNVRFGATNQPPMPGDIRRGIYVFVCLGSDVVSDSSVIIAESFVARKEFPSKPDRSNWLNSAASVDDRQPGFRATRIPRCSALRRGQGITHWVENRCQKSFNLFKLS